MDRHAIWRRVEHDFKHALERRGQGHEPLVLVWVAGRPEPLEIGYVETRRGPEDVWVRLQSGWTPPEDGSKVIPPRTYWYHVPESAILGVEVAYRRSEGAGIGFVYNDDPDVDDEPSLAVA
jgi:hypothetical protein